MNSVPDIFMFSLIKSIFGATRPKRAESEEASSKRRVFVDPHPRQTNSIDGKNKLETYKK